MCQENKTWTRRVVVFNFLLCLETRGIEKGLRNGNDDGLISIRRRKREAGYSGNGLQAHYHSWQRKELLARESYSESHSGAK